MKRIHQAFEITNGLTLLLCGQKGQKTTTMPGLSLSQQTHHQECLSNTQCSKYFGQITRIKILHCNGHMTQIQQYSYSQTRQMERSIQDESRIIQANCHVLRNVQQPSNIPNNDEHNICTTYRQKPHTGLHRQHSHSCSNKETITQDNERSTQNTSGARLISQIREMPICQTTTLLSQIYHLF